MNLDEKKLLDLAKKGDVEAFESLVEAYQKKVYNIALRMVGNPDDAEEIAQEVFIRIFKSLKNFKGQAQFYTWIYRITSNVCLDELRKRKNKRVIYLDQEIANRDNELGRQIGDESFAPDIFAEQNQLKKMINDALQQLPEKHRIILIMRDICGMSYEDIAKALESPIGTVKSRISRARQALKDKLKNKRELFDGYFVNNSKGGV